MGNHTPIETNTNKIHSNTSHHNDDFQLLFSNIVDQCNENVNSCVRLPLQISTIVLGLPTNVALLWLLVRGKKALSPSEVLGLNLAVLNIMFCLTLPIDVYLSFGQRTGPLLPVSEALSILNIMGCPLLLTSMCLERYLATAHAVLYMKIGSKWEYRVICSMLIWMITLVMAAVTYQQRLPKLSLYFSITLDVFLLIMLACLLGIMHELRKKGPGEGKTGERSVSSIKKRALTNALMILIPTTVIYGPLLALMPYMLTLSDENDDASVTRCLILNLINTFPSLGTCIGPIFYMSRAKQLACWRKNAEKELTMTQEQ